MNSSAFEELYQRATLMRIAGKQRESIEECKLAIGQLLIAQPTSPAARLERVRQMALLLELRAFCRMQMGKLTLAEGDAEKAAAEAGNYRELRLVYIHAITTQIRIMIRQGRLRGCDGQLLEIEKQLKGRSDPESLRLRGSVLSLIGVVRFRQKYYDAAFQCFADAEKFLGSDQAYDPVRRLRNMRRWTYALAYRGRRGEARIYCKHILAFATALPTGSHPESEELVRLIEKAVSMPFPPKWILRPYQQEAGF